MSDQDWRNDRETGAAATARALRAAWSNSCPACGGGRLARGLLTPEDVCRDCGADFRRHAAGDGAIFLVLLLLCVLVLGTAVVLEAWFAPPLWAHAVIAAVLTGGLTLAFLPITKRFMIAQSFVMDARGDLGDEGVDDERGAR